jgi:hypothetical protein
MNAPDKVTIELYSNRADAQITLHDTNGTVRRKSVSAKDIAGSLAESIRMTTEMLPGGTRFYGGVPSRYNITIEIPASVRTMQLIDSSARKYPMVGVPFPTMLVGFTVSNRSMTAAQIFALAEPLRSETDALYRFPFGNTSFNGAVCWGDVARPPIEKPMDLTAYISLLLDSGYNGDLVDRDTFRGTALEGYAASDLSRDNLSRFVECLKGRTRFPSDCLCRMINPSCVKDLNYDED